MTLATWCLQPGQRVATMAHTDAWMQGDRYGTVIKVGRKYLHVQMDSGRKLRFLIEKAARRLHFGRPEVGCEQIKRQQLAHGLLRIEGTGNQILQLLRTGVQLLGSRTFGRRIFSACAVFRPG